ncbi:MAG: DUF6715 family protein [Lachnotalea sp.]
MKKLKNVFILGVFAALIVGYYFHLSNRTTSDPTDQAAVTTAIEDAIAKDATIVMNTPRATIKFYSTILDCLYNEEPSNEQILALGEKVRELFDQELLDSNPEKSYLDALNTDTGEYAKAKRILMGFAIESGDDVEYYTEEDVEYAIVNASYTLRETDTFTKSNEEYILRKDENGYWKILGWRVVADEVTDTENSDE